MSNDKKQILSGFVFTFLEKIGAQGISFVVSIILANILMPEEYGIIAIALIFIALCDVFVNYGFCNSLVVNQKSDSKDFSTCFYFSIFLSIIFYGLSWVAAPYLAKYFGYEVLTPLLRLLGLRLPIVAINSVQQSYVLKNMLFKKLLYSTLIGNSCSGGLSIYLALKGWGIWALVFQSICTSLFYVILLWIFVKWRPTLEFSWKRLKVIYDYGWKILVVGLIDKLYSQIRDIVIAKKYSADELAYYNRGMQFPMLGMNILEPTLANVLFPALAKCNDNYAEMKSVLRRVIKLSTYLITPFFVGLACIAQPLVLTLLTEKWASAIIFLQLGCLAFLFSPIQIINSTLIRASGRSDLLLKLDIIKKGIGLILLIASIRFGIMAIVISFIITNIISALVNIFPNRKIFKYGYKDQLRDILPSYGLAVLMAFVILPIQLLGVNNLVTLVSQIFIGASVYITFSLVFKVDSFNYLLTTLQSYLVKLK